MSKFTSVNFKDHTMMANKMLTFLFMSKDSKDLSSFDSKIDALKYGILKKCKDSKDVASAASSAAEQAKKASTTANNKIADLQKRCEKFATKDSLK